MHYLFAASYCDSKLSEDIRKADCTALDYPPLRPQLLVPSAAPLEATPHG